MALTAPVEVKKPVASLTCLICLEGLLEEENAAEGSSAGLLLSA